MEVPGPACEDALMGAAGFDLVVRGGTIVCPGRREIADVGLRDGRIAQLGGAMSGRASSTPVACWSSRVASTRTSTWFAPPWLRSLPGSGSRRSGWTTSGLARLLPFGGHHDCWEHDVCAARRVHDGGYCAGHGGRCRRGCRGQVPASGAHPSRGPYRARDRRTGGCRAHQLEGIPVRSAVRAGNAGPMPLQPQAALGH
jgi:hypothetical protein